VYFRGLCPGAQALLQLQANAYVYQAQQARTMMG
jgi:hypothetical protein